MVWHIGRRSDSVIGTYKVVAKVEFAAWKTHAGLVAMNITEINYEYAAERVAVRQ